MTIFVWTHKILLVLQVSAKSNAFFSGIFFGMHFFLVTEYATFCVGDFQFSVSFACSAPSKMATSIPDEYLKCYISTTINPRDSKFGSSIADNECLNFDLYHVDRFESRDLVEAT